MWKCAIQWIFNCLSRRSISTCPGNVNHLTPRSSSGWVCSVVMELYILLLSTLSTSCPCWLKSWSSWPWKQQLRKQSHHTVHLVAVPQLPIPPSGLSQNVLESELLLKMCVQAVWFLEVHSIWWQVEHEIRIQYLLGKRCCNRSKLTAVGSFCCFILSCTTNCWLLDVKLRCM